MRSLVFLPTLLLSTLFFTSVLANWSKEDYEIFRLRDEVELNEGEGTTFYDFIGCKKGTACTIDDINKAYKRTSRNLHPDKHRPPKHLSSSQARASQKKASERFARLGIIAAILRGPDRERYDHFLNNGFPKWRGTGYYYARFRPGIGSVLVGLWLALCVSHYGVMGLQAKQHRRHMSLLIQEARQAAWGSAGVPGLADLLAKEDAGSGSGSETSGLKPPTNRKERRTKTKKGDASPVSGTNTPVPGAGGARRKVYLQNGMSFVVDSVGNVFLIDGEEELLLDLKDVEGARWKKTILFTVPMWFWRVSIGRFLPKKKDEDIEEYEDEEVEGEVGTGAENSAPTKNKKGVPKKVEGSIAGGRRRVKSRPNKK